MKIICCNCYYGDKEEWEIIIPGKFKCPKCNDDFVLNIDGSINELP